MHPIFLICYSNVELKSSFCAYIQPLTFIFLIEGLCVIKIWNVMRELNGKEAIDDAKIQYTYCTDVVLLEKIIFIGIVETWFFIFMPLQVGRFRESCCYS